jgi:chromosome segregation ATPase
VEELEESHREAHLKFEAALEHQEHQLELKEDEIEGANLDIKRLGQRVWELEDEAERLKEDSERARGEATVDREALESVSTALKEVRPNIYHSVVYLILTRFSRNWLRRKTK